MERSRLIVLKAMPQAVVSRAGRRLAWLGAVGTLWGGTLSSGLAQGVIGDPGGLAATTALSPVQDVPVRLALQSANDASAQDSALLNRLISETEYWLAQHQFKHAQDTANRALDIAPQNAQALLLLGSAQKGLGDLAGAENTLARMESVGASLDMRAALRDVIAANPVDPERLAQARALAAAGKMLQAAMAYKALFGNAPPPQDLALEYYTVLGSTILGYQEAVTRLREWLKRNPADLDAQLLYYRILTYRETSRLLGLDGVKKLALADVSPRIRRQAYDAWRQTLLWLAVRGSSIPLYYEWLTQHPKDAEIADRLEKAREEQKRIDADTARIDAFSQLNAGHVDEAEKGFQQALAYNAKDAAALGGVGLVAERQHDWQRAEQNFKLAMEADPATAGQWSAALAGVRQGMAGNSPLPAQIARALATRRYDDARRDITRLAQIPGQQTVALLFRAQLETKLGHRAEAEEAYRGVVSRMPRNSGAVAMLVNMLLQDGRIEDAERLIQESGYTSSALAARVHSARLVQQAGQTTDDDERVSLLNEAVETTPNDPWVRLKLAQALAATHHADQGRAIMAVLTDQPHPSREALTAAALYADGQNDFATSEALIRRLPPAALTQDMHRVMERAQAESDISAAERLGSSAVTGLKALADRPDPSGQRALLVASALLRHDEAQAAYDVLKKGEAQASGVSPSQRLSYAGLYLHIMALSNSAALQKQAQRDVLANLNAYDAGIQEPGQEPTEHETQTRNQVEDGLMAIQADALVKNGWPDDALRLGQPYTATHPDAVQSRLALARVYEAKNKPAQALAEDMDALKSRPDDPRILRAAVHEATMADDAATAASLTQKLQTLAPEAPETWSAVAENAQAHDDTRSQLAAMEHVQSIECESDNGDACDRHDVLKPDYRWPLIESGYQDLRGATLPAAYHELPADTTSEANNRSIVYLHDSLSSQLDGNFYVRNRTGDGGLGQLTELAVPITGTLPFESWNHRISFSIAPTFLFTGNPLANTSSNHQFGQCATIISTGRCSGSGHNYNVQGVGLNINYVNHWFSADIGSSPLGFPIANILGDIEFAPHLTRDLVLRLSGGRQMVTNSELSYAGMKDPVSGRTWGAVTREYGEGMFEWVRRAWSLYAGAGFAYLDGTHVVSNTEVDAHAGGIATIWNDQERQRVRAGLDFSYYGYRRNSDLFTWGQGGYFSPQEYYAIMVPLEWSGHRDMWTWLLRGEGGFQHYRSNGSDYFPLNDGLQKSAVSPATQGRQSASGAAGNVMGKVVYQATPALRLGLQVGYSRAGNWSELTAFLMAHYTFDSFGH
ncbi:cellulose biosynthesis protein BcsC [Acetobacter peroxydans]|uniref:cellulose biosynthesis protein BcsC n=2 Tax=Acetobacter TaxID=434 RepID=UPI0022315D73|nr:cellulose biosynthesis protein BcsC [Acetobacter peroxydans]